MTDKLDLQLIQERADDVHTLFVCLQNAGFEKAEALMLMQPCLIIGVPWKQELTR